MTNFEKNGSEYLKTLHESFDGKVYAEVEILAKELRKAWTEGSRVFICGNGGSAANAIHLANDLHYGIGCCGQGRKLPGLRVEALSANSAIITCLANDTGYENIYAHQIYVKGEPGDIMIALSGSGNSPNVVKAIEKANELKIKTYAIVAYTGGKCLQKANNTIHFKVNDMQIAEDLQLIVGHLCMQWLNTNKPEKVGKISYD